MAGTIVTVAACVIGTFLTKPNYYADKNWSLSTQGRADAKVALEPMDRQILEYLYSGATTLAEITDLLEVDSFRSSQSVERLDQGGYIRREGLRGAKFYTLHMTDKGRSALGDRTQRQETLSANGLNEEWLEVLAHCDLGLNEFGAYLTSAGITSLKGAAIISVLTTGGYIRQYGNWRRKIAISDKGHAILSQLKVS